MSDQFLFEDLEVGKEFGMATGEISGSISSKYFFTIRRIIGVAFLASLAMPFALTFAVSGIAVPLISTPVGLGLTSPMKEGWVASKSNLSYKMIPFFAFFTCSFGVSRIIGTPFEYVRAVILKKDWISCPFPAHIFVYALTISWIACPLFSLLFTLLFSPPLLICWIVSHSLLMSHAFSLSICRYFD